jgi:hypothetical protein
MKTKRFDPKKISKIEWNAIDGGVDVYFFDADPIEPFSKSEFNKNSKTWKFIDNLERDLWRIVYEN